MARPGAEESRILRENAFWHDSELGVRQRQKDDPCRNEVEVDDAAAA